MKDTLNKPEAFIYGGNAFVHTHIDKKEIIQVINEFKKVGNRYIAVCSFCGTRGELK